VHVQEGLIHVRVTKAIKFELLPLSPLLMRLPLQIGDESTINNILRLMEDAQSSKAPVQRFADRVILSLLFLCSEIQQPSVCDVLSAVWSFRADRRGSGPADLLHLVRTGQQRSVEQLNVLSAGCRCVLVCHMHRFIAGRIPKSWLNSESNFLFAFRFGIAVLGKDLRRGMLSCPRFVLHQ
jgi:hypothetical protein